MLELQGRTTVLFYGVLYIEPKASCVLGRESGHPLSLSVALGLVFHLGVCHAHFCNLAKAF